MTVNEREIIATFEAAEKEGRSFLLEHEVYAVLRAAGMTVPKHIVLPKDAPLRKEDLDYLETDEVVVKIISPLVLHKSDVGGVRFVKRDAEAIRKAAAEMIASVPDSFMAWIGRKKSGHSGDPSYTKKGIADSLRGVLVTEKVAFENVGFGSEWLVGVRDSREFGPVMTVGGGGLDVEYMNERIQEGKAVSLFSIHLFEKEGLRAMLEPLAVFGKIALPFRGRKPVISPEAMTDDLLPYAELARKMSSFSPDFPFTIEEFEVNPIVVRKGHLVPLDGLCRFSRRKENLASRPLDGIRRLLRPETIGIIGVSEKMNVGRMILGNILKNGFSKDKVFIVKPGASQIDGCVCVPTVGDLPGAVDLFVLTLGAEQSYDVMKEIVEKGKARSVIIIAGGLGEKQGTQDLEGNIRDLVARGRKEGRLTPVLNGGNCLGIASKPGHYDTTFIPDHKLPRPKGRKADLAVISQSGAFMISRMSKLQRIEPVFAVSLGNQIDLTASDYLEYLKNEPDVRTFAIYMEGFKPGDGLIFARAVKTLTAQGKTVVIYKSGRSPEGRGAASSHTASVAGDYPICASVLKQAGAIVCEDILEFENTVRGVTGLAHKKVRGNRVGLVSNAGFECVIMADSLKDADGTGLRLSEFSPETHARIVEALKPLGIDRLQDVHNPLDTTPMADDAAFCGAAEAVLEDVNTDCVVLSPLPMTAALQTLAPSAAYRESILDPGSTAQKMIALFEKTDKPFVVNLDAGVLYDPLCDLLEEAGIPVFRRCDEALAFLRKYVRLRMARP